MLLFPRPPPPHPVGPGQESVWDYPRPPRIEPTPRRLQIVLGGQLIADCTRGLRVLETSHPPTYYLHPDDFVDGALVPVAGSSFCEWKGRAVYFDVVGGGEVGTGRTSAVIALRVSPNPGRDGIFTFTIDLVVSRCGKSYVDGASAPTPSTVCDVNGHVVSRNPPVSGTSR